MSRKLSILDNVRIASPCHVPWASMKGDERVRHCDSCKLNVFNLSEMTRADAEALLISRNGRLCIRYYQRADGTILTTDCPVGLWKLRRRFIRLIAGVAAAFAFVAIGLQALATGKRAGSDLRLAYFQPFWNVSDWLTQRLPRKPSPPIWGVPAIDVPEGTCIRLAMPSYYDAVTLRWDADAGSANATEVSKTQ